MTKGKPSPEKYVIPNEIREEVRMLVKDFMKNEGISSDELAKRLNEVYGRSASRTNILNKLARGSFSLAEFLQIIRAYSYELTLVKVDRTTDNGQKP